MTDAPEPTELLPPTRMKEVVRFTARPLSDFVVCKKCGFYRLKTDNLCQTRGCSENPETKKKHRRGK